jgi:hypothetical protein
MPNHNLSKNVDHGKDLFSSSVAVKNRILKVSVHVQTVTISYTVYLIFEKMNIFYIYILQQFVHYYIEKYLS